MKIGIETGPMTVWLWHALTERELPVLGILRGSAADGRSISTIRTFLLATLSTDAQLVMHRLALFEAWGLGIDWHRFDLGTARLGHVAASLQASGAWDHFLCVASAERAAIELMDDVPASLSFDHADKIFENLTTLRPRLMTDLLKGCTSIRAERLFLFFADCHAHGWAKRIDRDVVDLGRGKRQLVPGGRLDARYQITVPEAFGSKTESEEQ